MERSEGKTKFDAFGELQEVPNAWAMGMGRQWVGIIQMGCGKSW